MALNGILGHRVGNDVRSGAHAPLARASDYYVSTSLTRSLTHPPTSHRKALKLRNNPAYPRLEQWFVAMEGRPSYRNIQSDFYTHVHDLPPQVGRCQMVAEARPLADAIDGTDGSWSLPLPVT